MNTTTIARSAVVLLMPAFAQLAWSQSTSEDDEKALVPVAVLNVAGVDRVLGNADAILKSAERPEMRGAIDGLLSRAGELEGLDRKRAFGIMVFLNEENLFSPYVAMYAPVANLEAMLETIALGPVAPRKVSGTENRYEIEGPRGSLYLERRGDYAFVSREEDIFDLKLPDPAKYTELLTERHDLALSLRAGAVSETIRNVFLTYLRINTESQLGQRVEESDAAFRIRRANTMANVELIELLLTQCSQLTLGWKINAENREATLELSAEALPDSDFADLMTDLSERRSSFEPWSTGSQPLVLTAGWQLAEREQAVLTEWIGALETRLRQNLGDETTRNPDDGVGKLVRVLRATVDDGAVDAGFQFVPQDEGHHVLIAALRVRGPETLTDGLQEIVSRLREDPDFETVEPNAAEYRGIRFHRLISREPRPQDERLYGGQPQLYLGCGERILWVAVGGDEAFPTLEDSIDEILDADKDDSDALLDVPPIQMTMRVATWLGMRPAGEANAGRRRFRAEAAREAFDETNDQIRLEVRPSETGLQLRLRMDEGVLRFMGLMVARGIEARMPSEPEPAAEPLP